MSSHLASRFGFALKVIFATVLVMTESGPVEAQVEFTEILANPSASPEGPWEWLEIHNTTGGSLDLNGYLLDDDQFSPLTVPNITADLGNTMISANGVAVLYNADDLTAQRFRKAWGSGITLIGVTDFPSLLNSGEGIGLWSSVADYGERDFQTAVAQINFATANIFPQPGNGQSIAWNGMGSSTDGTNWAVSVDGSEGASFSTQTLITAQVNNTDDVASPGVVPNTPSSPGLFITEMMVNPASTSDGDFEFVEIFNNTGSAIDFTVTGYVLDDDDFSDLADANVTAGTVGAGETAVLFNDNLLSTIDMQNAWGADVNFIPVSDWSGLANNGDTIGIWDSYAAYTGETMTGAGRSTHNSVAAVRYENNASGWPNDDGNGSIYLVDLASDPSVGDNWQLSTTGDGLSVAAMPIVTTTEDNPGSDVGSPGRVPYVETGSNRGDYNNNGTVDVADYPIWRNTLHEFVPPFSAADGNGSGRVEAGDYDHWKSRFGLVAARGVLQVPEPPAGQIALVGGLAAVIILAGRGASSNNK